MASITEIHFNGDEKAITVEKDFNFVTAKLGNQEIVLQFTTVGGSRVAIRKDALPTSRSETATRCRWSRPSR